MPHSGGTLIMHTKLKAKKMIVTGTGPVANQKNPKKTKNLLRLRCYWLVYNLCLNNRGAKRALDLVHALLGVSHSCWAAEIALFLSRWCWAGPSSITNHSGVAVGLMQGPASKLSRAWFFYLFPLDTYSVFLCNSPLTLKAKMETLLFWKHTVCWKLSFFFTWCKTWRCVISI